MKRQSEAFVDRNEIYEERFNKFLSKIRSYQSDQLKKIGEKSNDEIQFQSNKIISDARQYDTEAFGKRFKTIDVESKIRKSRKTNEARLSKMKVRFEMIEKVQNQIKTKLVQMTANGQHYQQLLQKLTIQGLIKMLEEKVEVKCLKRDVQLVRQILPNCQKQFGDMCEVKTKLVLSPETLPQSDLGGIILTSFNGKIVCNNTLRARLQYALQQSLPQVRSNLFPTESTQSSAANVQKAGQPSSGSPVKH